MKSSKKFGRASKFTVSTLNAQSISNQCYLLELENALDEVNFDIIGLSEVKRVGEGKIPARGFTLFYSGIVRNRGTVGFAVKSRWMENVTAFKSLSDRVALLELQFGSKTMGIIQCYAPTSAASESEINVFYDDISKALDDFSSCAWLFVIGDFNAKIGVSNGDEKEVVGPFGLGQRNERGDVLVDFARRKELFICNSRFKKKDSKRWTWHLGRAFNEIDFIMTRKTQSNLVTDVSVVNGLKFNSDHRLVRAQVKLEVKPKPKFLHRTSKVVVNRDPFRMKEFNDKLQENLPSLQNLSPQQAYDNFSQAIMRSSEMFRTKQPKRQILSHETKLEIQSREALKKIRFESSTMNAEFIAQRKKTNKLIRRDVYKHEVQQVEDAINNGTSLNNARNGASSNKSWIPQLRDEKGVVVSRRDDVLEVAAKFYENLFKSTLPVDENLGTKDESLLNPDEEELEKITLDELEYALSSVKNGKAVGPDGLTTDLLKISKEEGLNAVVDLFNKILESEEIPSQWYDSTIILIHKGGDKKDIAKYRPITLTSHLYKLFMRVIMNRVSDDLDANQPPNQAAFRKGFSTTDHLFVMNQLIEKCYEFNQPFVCAFVDFSKAFDSVEHPYLLDSLKDQGVPSKILRLLKKIYDNSRARIKMEKHSRWFKVGRGIKQGDPFSPKAFNAVLERIFRNVQWNGHGFRLDNAELCELRFADDVVLMSNNEAGLCKLMSNVFQESKRAGLIPNVEKTQILSNIGVTDLIVDEEKFKAVDVYRYLGQPISFNDAESQQIDARVSSGWKAFWSLKKHFKSFLPLHLKKRLYDACVLPVLTYGCQTWSLSEGNSSKLAVAQRSMERSMLHKKMKDRVSSLKLRKATKLKDVIETTRELKWNWAGHLARYPNERLPNAVVSWEPKDAKRRKGRPRRRWKDDIVNTASFLWKRKAQNRQEWKKIGTSFIRK
jgi:hypothetical protein